VSEIEKTKTPETQARPTSRPNEGEAREREGRFERLWQATAVLAAELGEKQKQLANQGERTARESERLHQIAGSWTWKIAQPFLLLERRLRNVLAATHESRRKLGLALRPTGAAGHAARVALLRAARRQLAAARTAWRAGVHAVHPQAEDPAYLQWCARFDSLNDADRLAIGRVADQASVPEVFLVYLLGADVAPAERLCDGLRAQIWPRWRAVLACSPACPEAAIETARKLAATDSRVTVVTGNSREGLGALAVRAGEALVLCAGRAILREHTLALLASSVRPGACVVYGDEDRLDAYGQRCDPFFKPGASPELLRHLDYLGDCVLLSGSQEELAEALASALTPQGLAPAARAFAARCDSRNWAHVPVVLAHIAGPKIDRGLDGSEPQLALRQLPRVSIIIPTRDRVELLAPCLGSIARSNYPPEQIEIVIIDNGSSDPATLAYLAAADAAAGVRVLRDDSPFNFSRLNNLAAREAQGDLLVFLNNDTLIEDPDWLARLAAYAMQRDVGAVGAKLLYADRTVQHAGVLIGVGYGAQHIGVGLSETDPGYHGLMACTREVGAVTAACLAIRRSVFEQLGGFDVQLAIAFNDVELCVDSIARGLRNICIARPLVQHLESKSRGTDDSHAKRTIFWREAALASRRRTASFRADPTYSPNLSVEAPFELAYPPRESKPWRSAGLRPVPRVLLLSETHDQGRANPVVVAQHASHFVRLGWRVTVGGPSGYQEPRYEGCERLGLSDAREAACHAVENAIDCVIAYSPLYFPLTRLLGRRPPVFLFDFGQADPEFFPDAQLRGELRMSYRYWTTLAARALAISPSVREDAQTPEVQTLAPGNTHLAAWSADLAERRRQARARHGWTDRFVVLNVTRFGEDVRELKGIDRFVELQRFVCGTEPRLAERVEFVLAGAASTHEARALRAAGVRAFAGISDAELTDLYLAADAYVSLARWTGFNFGVAQALAFGLPVFASNIAAHRSFTDGVSLFPAAGGSVTGTPPSPQAEIAPRLAALAKLRTPGESRTPILHPWDKHLEQITTHVLDACMNMPQAREAHRG
jgi:GT2 family glycosyltransferase